MTRLVIMAPRISDGARSLADNIREGVGIYARYRRRDVNSYNNKEATHFINWGCGGDVHPNQVNVAGISFENALNLNTDTATNKLSAFEAMQRWSSANPREVHIRVPDYCTNHETAERILSNNRRPIYCRTSLRGHSGEDIVIANSPQELVDAPLYTLGVDKRHEFRLHVFKGVVIDGVRKGFRSDIPEEERDLSIMNHAAGTIFVRSGPALEAMQQNEEVQQMAVNACRALGLDFGAVDIMTDREGRAYVLEVNTAPGLVETTLARYTQAVTEWIQGNPITAWNNQSQIQTQTQEETTMSVLQTPNTSASRRALIGRLVEINHNFTGSSLNLGVAYQIEECSLAAGGAVKIKIRTDRLRSYTLSGQFNLLPPASAVPATPQEPQGIQPHPTGVRVDVPSDSPERCVSLPDGTAVNVGGQVQYTGSGSSVLSANTTYQVSEIRAREDDNTVVFIGITMDGTTRRWNRSNFGRGQVQVNGITATTAAAPEPTPPQNQVNDNNNRALSVGDNVVIITRAGGHGFRTGTRGQVVSLNENNMFTFESSDGVRRTVRGNRVRFLEAREAEQASQVEPRVMGTTNVSIGNNNYRIRSVDAQSLRTFVQTLTI